MLRFFSALVLLAATGCALHRSPAASPLLASAGAVQAPGAAVPQPAQPGVANTVPAAGGGAVEAAAPNELQPAVSSSVAGETVAAAATVAPANSALTPEGAAPSAAAAEWAAPEGEPAEPEDADEGAEDAPVEEEGESRDVANAPVVDGYLYTSDLSDEDLQRQWKDAPEALGSISIGFVDEGRVLNAERFPTSDDWQVVTPWQAFATRETIDYLSAAIRKVREQYPDAPPLRVNALSGPEGGYLRPHKSHQSGRDVDLGLYYPTAEPVRVREREKYIDVRLNWALIKALVTETDVQLILLDRRVQKVIYDYALANGEDPKWLDSLFRNGRSSVVQHARRHRDHFHVRFFNPRAQELGRRVAPLLAQRPEHNLAIHRVRKGDTLGAIALKYGSTVAMLRKANRMKGSFLRIAQVLKVPLRGPCTRCPIPPPVVVPPRRLPPEAVTAPTEKTVDVAPSAEPSAALSAPQEARWFDSGAAVVCASR